MKFIVDAQLPPALAQWLRDQGHEAGHVQEIGLHEAEDSPIWNHALEQNTIILTKDEDFSSRVRQSRRAPVIIWLRIGNCSNSALQEWFAPLFPEIIREIKAGERLIEVR